MSFFSNFYRPRVLALAGASLLLHYFAVGWVNANVRPLALDAAEAAPPAVRVQLRQAAPPPAPKPAPSKPKARPKPAAAAPVAPPVDPGAGSAAAPADHAAPEPVAPEPEPVVEAPPEPVAEPAPQAEPAEPPVPEPRRYKTEQLPSATLTLNVARKDAKGSEHSGEGTIAWTRDGGNYKVVVEASVSVLVTRLNLLVSTSEGRIGEDGLAPLKFTEKRLSRALTATHFLRDDGRITYSASERSDPLSPGAQDKASVPFQLAAIARADPAQLSGEVEIQVGSEREAVVYRFVLVGEEPLETEAWGTLQTVHVSRPPRPGSYNSRLDIWFAPSLGWYPVLIRNTEANGAVTTQAVTKIDTSAGK